MSMIKIYTDGSAIPNPGMGGWSCVIVPAEHVVPNEHTITLSGAQPNTTNNVMELTALYEALNYCKTNGHSNVIIYSDSQYTVNIHNTWAHAWRKKGWKKKGGEIKNIDIIKRIYGLSQELQSRCEWVRGHDVNPFNNLADELANKMALSQVEKNYAKYATTEAGAMVGVTLKGSYWCKRYRVVAKFLGSGTIALNPAKKGAMLLLNAEEFDSQNYITL